MFVDGWLNWFYFFLFLETLIERFHCIGTITVEYGTWALDGIRSK